MKRSGVYIIENTQNKKLYVGSSMDLKQRRDNHSTKLKHGGHINKHLQASYNKYGKDCFLFKIIEELDNPSKEFLLEREQYWIDKLTPEYNILKTAGSTLGFKHSKETKEKISNSTIGVKKSKEHSINISLGQKGRKLSEEHKQKLSESAKTRTLKCHVSPIEIDGIKYDSLKEASEITGIKYNTIQKRLKNSKFSNYRYLR